MVNRKIYFLYVNFAYEKSARSLASRFLHDSSVEKIYFLKFTSVSDFRNFSLQHCWSGNILFLGCGGKLLNQCIRILREKNIICTTVSMFPGIVVHSQVDAFFTRVRVDYVLINSEKDFYYYKFLCFLLGVPFNGLLIGPSWIDVSSLDESATKEKIAIYFEQLHVPSSNEDKLKLINCLKMIAKNNKDYILYIKNRPIEGYKGLSIFDFCARNSIEFPQNLKNLQPDNEATVSKKARVAISISSSSVIESIFLKQHVFLIKDFQSRENFANFFENSGLFVFAKDIKFECPVEVNKKWLLKNYTTPVQLNTGLFLNRGGYFFSINVCRFLFILPLIFILSPVGNLGKNLKDKLKSFRYLKI